MAERFAPGDLIGDYRVTARTGNGTYHAVHMTLDRHVSIKVAPEDRTEEMSVEMMRAARVCRVLRHPGIAGFVDWNVLPDRRPWIAAELPDGTPLTEILVRRRLSSDEVTSILHFAAEALGYAHHHQVFHRNLRPQNILIVAGQFPITITDWGDINLDLPRTSEYTAPEVASGGLDGRIDVFALGVVAYRAVIGSLPSRRAAEPWIDTPPQLANLITRMMSADPDDRPGTAEIQTTTTLLAQKAAANRVQLSIDDLDDAEVTPPRFGRPKWTPPTHLAPPERPTPPSLPAPLPKKR